MAGCAGAATLPGVDCFTVDAQGDVAYRVTARGSAREPLARVLSTALGNRQHPAGISMLSVADASRLLALAYS
jgi:hypothetical protein